MASSSSSVNVFHDDCRRLPDTGSSFVLNRIIYVWLCVRGGQIKRAFSYSATEMKLETIELVFSSWNNFVAKDQK